MWYLRFGRKYLRVNLNFAARCVSFVMSELSPGTPGISREGPDKTELVCLELIHGHFMRVEGLQVKLLAPELTVTT